MISCGIGVGTGACRLDPSFRDSAEVDCGAPAPRMFMIWQRGMVSRLAQVGGVGHFFRFHGEHGRLILLLIFEVNSPHTSFTFRLRTRSAPIT